MIGSKARPPDYVDNVPVYLYWPGEWKRTIFTEQPRGILHSIFPVHWQGRGEQLMTADFLGIRLFLPKGPVEISKGDPRPCPQMSVGRRLGLILGGAMLIRLSFASLPNFSEDGAFSFFMARAPMQRFYALLIDLHTHPLANACCRTR